MAEVVELGVTGMTCGHCAETVTNALESVDGVDSAEVSVDLSRAEVPHDGSVARAVLVAAVAGAGVSAAGEAAAEATEQRRAAAAKAKTDANMARAVAEAQERIKAEAEAAFPIPGLQ